MYSYTVCCELEDSNVAAQWLEWLRAEHLAEVCAAGAESAVVVAIDDAKHRYEVRYSFASRAAFEAYERDHAPRLRAEGLARFPPSLGLQYARTSGEVVASHPGSHRLSGGG